MLDKQAMLTDSLFKKEEVDSFLSTSTDDIFYLTGFTGSEASILISSNGYYFFSDFRYKTQAEREVTNAEIIIYKDKVKKIKDFIKIKKLKRIGFDPRKISYDLYEKYRRVLPVDTALVPVKKGISSLRLIKRNEEIERIKNAATIAEKSLNSALKHLKEGISERALSLKFEYMAKKNGADKLSFDTIVASGVRGALPHGKASDKLVGRNELLTIDFGVILKGYCSDETVTLSIGKATGKQKEVCQIVYDAQRYAFEKIREGVRLKDIDSAARGFIERKGYGKYFGHGLGHGVGISVHEEPVISFKSRGYCKENMVFTVEPGIYIPGWGGVRIEDIVVVKRNYFEKITSMKKELKELEV